MINLRPRGEFQVYIDLLAYIIAWQNPQAEKNSLCNSFATSDHLKVDFALAMFDHSYLAL